MGSSRCLGADLRTLQNLCRDDAEALDELDKVTKREPCKHHANDNVMSMPRKFPQLRASSLSQGSAGLAQ
jgi:hypothetical protein